VPRAGVNLSLYPLLKLIFKKNNFFLKIFSEKRIKCVYIIMWEYELAKGTNGWSKKGEVVYFCWVSEKKR
jgi:hypothetical protein